MAVEHPEWQRSLTANDILNLSRSPKHRPFDSARRQGPPLVTQDQSPWFSRSATSLDNTMNSLNMTQNSDGSLGSSMFNRTHMSTKSSCLSEPPQDVTHQAVRPTLVMSKTAESLSAVSSPKSRVHDATSRTSESVLDRSGRTGRGEHALDKWELGQRHTIMNHIEPSKFRDISLHGPSFRGFYNQDWSNVDHIRRLREQHPSLRMQGQAGGLGPYPQGLNCEEIGKNRNFGKSHGSKRFTSGLLILGRQACVP
eukprot:gnl/TRDRNA2_/TRDRNA2_48573_c0_seq1.p1 gnl/TRDRNA2_/TRDRNA2_48573_c0~~gnl/TRDRNA2_/TRDRNA2_48573_c0_seq1.p1  ORF type:complete len:275 (-),score=24.84 gnl/TRDRNA2_/TRDRNA2_48573_c0_seq1:125-886(-)